MKASITYQNIVTQLLWHNNDEVRRKRYMGSLSGNLHKFVCSLFNYSGKCRKRPCTNWIEFANKISRFICSDPRHYVWWPLTAMFRKESIDYCLLLVILNVLILFCVINCIVFYYSRKCFNISNTVIEITTDYQCLIHFNIISFL